jgi:hypothetical protein
MDHWGTKRSEMMRVANNHTTSGRDGRTHFGIGEGLLARRR